MDTLLAVNRNFGPDGGARPGRAEKVKLTVEFGDAFAQAGDTDSMEPGRDGCRKKVA
jgi:hypothetical protein